MNYFCFKLLRDGGDPVDETQAWRAARIQGLELEPSEEPDLRFQKNYVGVNYLIYVLTR